MKKLLLIFITFALTSFAAYCEKPNLHLQLLEKQIKFVEEYKKKLKFTPLKLGDGTSYELKGFSQRELDEASRLLYYEKALLPSLPEKHKNNVQLHEQLKKFSYHESVRYSSVSNSFVIAHETKVAEDKIAKATLNTAFDMASYAHLVSGIHRIAKTLLVTISKNAIKHPDFKKLSPYLRLHTLTVYNQSIYRLSKLNHQSRQMLGASNDKTKVKETITAIVECLDDVEIQDPKYKDRFFHFLIDTVLDDSLLVAKQHRPLFDPIIRHPNLDEGDVRLLLGRFCIKDAWAARGGGWAGEVKEDGWKIYKEKLEEGRRLLEESHKMKPRAITAKLLITNSMGDGKESTEKWLKEAMLCQPDSNSVIDSYLWSIRPRWGGSVEEIRKAAYLFANSNAYHTNLPEAFVTAMAAIKEERKLGLNAFKSNGVSKVFVTIYENYLLKETNPSCYCIYIEALGVAYWLNNEPKKSRAMFELLPPKTAKNNSKLNLLKDNIDEIARSNVWFRDKSPKWYALESSYAKNLKFNKQCMANARELFQTKDFAQASDAQKELILEAIYQEEFDASSPDKPVPVYIERYGSVSSKGDEKILTPTSPFASRQGVPRVSQSKNFRTSMDLKIEKLHRDTIGIGLSLQMQMRYVKDRNRWFASHIRNILIFKPEEDGTLTVNYYASTHYKRLIKQWKTKEKLGKDFHHYQVDIVDGKLSLKFDGKLIIDAFDPSSVKMGNKGLKKAGIMTLVPMRPNPSGFSAEVFTIKNWTQAKLK